MPVTSNDETLRIDHALSPGTEISTNYDPLLAKVITWGETRESARTKLKKALTEFSIIGLDTNVPFLTNIITHPNFSTPPLVTDFIGDKLTELTTHDDLQERKEEAIVSALLTEILSTRTYQEQLNPFYSLCGWRASSSTESPHRKIFRAPSEYQLTSRTAGEDTTVRARVLCTQLQNSLGCTVEINGETSQVTDITKDDVGHLSQFTHRGRNVRPSIAIQEAFLIFIDGYNFIIKEITSASPQTQDLHTSNHLTAPLSGVILSISVNAGSEVKKGDTLIIIESMKIEHAIRSTRNGVVASLNTAIHDTVHEGDLLLTLE